MSVTLARTSPLGGNQVGYRHAVRLAAGILVTSALAPGCAHIERFQSEEPPPMLGRSAPESARPTSLVSEATAPAGQDDYAAWLERRTPALHGRSVPGSGESEQLATQSPASAYPLEESRPPVEVALQPPVAEPLASDITRTTLESPDVDIVSLPPASVASAPRAAADDLAQIRVVVEDSMRQLTTLNTYQVMMTRQENVKGEVQPAEDVLLSIRRDPRAVRLEWLDGPNKGREVIYNEGGLMHVNMPGSLVPRISLPPDSPIALKNSRHPISEAGFAKIVEQIWLPLQQAAGQGQSAAGRFRYGGVASPAPGAPACHEIVRVTPSGETWTVHIDDATKLPYIVHAEDAAGNLLEHYVFRDPKFNVVELTAADAFDHEARWGQPSGLLTRLARGGEESSSSPANSSSR